MNTLEGPEGDLQVIRRLMEGARETTTGNSRHLILWGCLLAAAELLTYGATEGALRVSPNLVWAVASTFGWVASVWLSRQARKAAPVNSLVTRILGAIWIGCGLGLTMIGFLGAGSGTLPSPVSNAVMAVALGTAFFATSFLPQHTLFRVLALLWWALGGVMFVFPTPANALLMAGALVFLMAVPGFVLSRRSAAPIGIALLS